MPTKSLVGLSGGKSKPRISPAKRLLDISASVAALIVLSPVMLVVAVICRLTMGKPVLFRQLRTGRGGVPFEILKFRTMRDAFDASGNPLPDEDRQVPVGRFLRKTSLDELPALINVARGDMSLVGPRPLLHEYLDLYSEEQLRRFEVPAGVTGLAQVNGRNLLSWDEKFALDIEYVDQRSQWLDIQILCKTVRQVLTQNGISEEGSVTATRFTGSSPSADRQALNGA